MIACYPITTSKRKVFSILCFVSVAVGKCSCWRVEPSFWRSNFIVASKTSTRKCIRLVAVDLRGQILQTQSTTAQLQYHFILRVWDGMLIFVRTLTKKAVTLKLSSRTRSGAKVRNKKSLLSDQHRRIFAEFRNNTKRTPAGHSVQKESTLCLVLCLRGSWFTV